MPILGSFAAASLRGFSAGGPIAQGQVVFTTPGTYSWTVPNGVTNISFVCIGGGAGFRSIDTVRACGGGALSWIGNLTVTPGTTVTVVVGQGGGLSGPAAGGTSLVQYAATNYCVANGGSIASAGTVAAGGTRTGISSNGGNGGTGQATMVNSTASGGGAGGYVGPGGPGVTSNLNTASTGGGGAGGYQGAGGGTDVLGWGTGGTARFAIGDGYQGSTGGGQGFIQSRAYGGGGGGSSGGSNNGGNGAVRIIWGPARAYAASAVLDVPEVIV